MTRYIFDALRGDGVSETFDCAEAVSDKAALAYAEQVLKAHASAARISVFDGGRHVGEVTARPNTGARRQLHSCSVLVVEDQFLLAEDLRRLLNEAGAEVVGPFRDARSAIAAARQRRPTCAIVDINLGDGPDFDAAKALLAAGVSIVFVTGYEADVFPAALAHLPHVRKPARREDILTAVETLCSHASLHC